MSSTADRIEVEQWRQFVSSIGFTFCALPILIILLSQSLRVYQDLFTKERKSISHRRAPPTVTIHYKWVAMVTVISIFFYFTACLLSAVVVSGTRTLAGCQIVVVMLLWSLHLSKISMYLVFLGRLWMVYGESPRYSYRPAFLIFIGSVVVIASITLMIMELVIMTGDNETVSRAVDNDNSNATYAIDNDNKYPHFCDFDTPEYIIVSYGMIDIIMSILYMILFIRPLRKTVRDLHTSSRNTLDVSKLSRKILYMGTKLMIITIFACVTSLIFIFILIAADFPVVGALDWVANSVCLALMTAYYDDKIFYSRICCICIACCGRSKDQPKKPKKDDTGKELSPPADTRSSIKASVDTMSAIRAAQPLTAVAKENINTSNNNEDQVDMANMNAAHHIQLPSNDVDDTNEIEQINTQQNDQ